MHKDNLYEQTEILSGKSAYMVDNSVDYKFVGLNIYGLSAQNGTPHPDSPVDVISAGSNGFDVVTQKGTSKINVVSWRSAGTIITAQPKTSIVKEGDTTYFAVSGGTNYQWQQNAGSGWIDIPAPVGTRNSLSIGGTAARNEYKYRCIVDGETSNEATLYVVAADSDNTSQVVNYTTIEPLRACGDVSDELIYTANGTAKIVRRCGVVTLTADNITGVNANAGLGNLFFTNVVGAIGENSDVKPMCNRFLGITFADRAIIDYLNVFRCFMGQDGRLILRNSAADNRFTTVAEMQEFVTANKTVVIYPLAEPTETTLSAAELTALMQLQTYDGSTSISNTANAKMTIEIKNGGIELQPFGFFPRNGESDTERTYGADDFTAYYRDFFTDGVHPSKATNLQVIANNDMTVTVLNGVGYVDGKFYRPVTNTKIAIPESDTQYDRYDMVVLRCDYITKSVYVDVVRGTAAADPEYPELQRTRSIYDLGLAAIMVKANTSHIAQENITDLRFDANYCGIITNVINSINTTNLFAQYNAEWNLLRAGIEQDEQAIIEAWSALNTTKSVNDIAPVDGNVTITQGDIPAGNGAYQLPYFVQSGSATTEGEITINFTTQYTTPPVVLVSFTPNSVLSSHSYGAYTSTITTNGVTIKSYDSYSTSQVASAGTVNWIALGE